MIIPDTKFIDTFSPRCYEMFDEEVVWDSFYKIDFTCPYVYWFREDYNG